MAVFGCSRCGAALTASVVRVALPVQAHHRYGHALLPALMEAGTYAVDPEPSGQPWRPWSEVGAQEAAERGVFAPVGALSFGPPGAVAVAPGDTRGTMLIPERCDGYCMGLDGRDGPNLACARCGQAVATRIDDCSYWQVVWLDPRAVRRLPDDGPAPEVADWAALVERERGTPPVEPDGRWSPRWEAAVGAALAHLLVASEGGPVAVPDGVLADTFGRALGALLPSGTPVRQVAPAGPGVPPARPAPDIALVPRHPRTGRSWRPTGAPADVSLPADVWTHMVSPRVRLPVPATGGLPDGVQRDDPLPMRPWSPFRPDSAVFLHTLARLPAVRRPWLREIYDRVRARPYDRPF
ncbi:hypothetical protein OG889_01375 [Streptomyces sp. NBC_00481]|uniref:hypothetical protein n=1 Tax=unclassified Streptomyces TaxID=2593676 RepID=UPI002DDB1ADD|nr:MULTISPECIES: hypothetical protein [unclassified Streptomyces]WRY93486.1 hypothetical protein OG889_01375 [Streptomyces sp. NBC_00481]